MARPMSAKEIDYKYESPDSYRLSDRYIQNVIEDRPFYEDTSPYRPGEKVIGFGSYIMVKTKLPVAEEHQPKVWHIYWAVPNEDSKNNDGYDKYGRYGVQIQLFKNNTVTRVVLFPHEYIVVTEEKLKQFIDRGYGPVAAYYIESKETLSLDLIEKARSLCEEEREIVWALQLDGLTENQACQQYFLCKHDEGAPDMLMYAPSAEVLQEIIWNFGEG